MAELSIPWDGTATGDAGTYTEDEWRDILRALSGGGGAVGSANVGVIGGLLNSLKPTSPGVDQIRAASGYAVVDGTVYKNTANVTKTMGTPAVGVTGKRLVLQKDWTAQEVRLAVIESADGVAALPALTQNDGVRWEDPICSFTHADVTGVIAAVTDEREFTNAVVIAIPLDGVGSVIATGIVNVFFSIPRPLHVYGWELLADQAGSIKIDVWMDTYAAYPPLDADSITGTDEPEIVAALKAQNLNIATEGEWTTELVAKSNLRFNVDSVATIQGATLMLYVAG
jgi:hypothetical protein